MYQLYGAGGGIRLVCDSLTGVGVVYARAHRSDVVDQGVIRYESNSISLEHAGDPPATMDLVGTTAVLWPESDAPRLEVTTVGGCSVPADPRPNFSFPQQDVSLATSDPVTIQLIGHYVPLDAVVTMRIASNIMATSTTLQATLTGGTLESSTWETSTVLPNGIMAMQARASWEEAP